MAERVARDHCGGLTLVEMMIAMVSAMVLMLGTLACMGDLQKAYNRAYDNAYCPAAEARVMARATFVRMMRMTSAGSGATVAPDGSWVEVQYYSSPDIGTADRTARFYAAGEDLLLRTSITATDQLVSLDTVCSEVASVRFTVAGSAVRMALVLDDGSQSRTLHVAAVMRSP